MRAYDVEDQSIVVGFAGSSRFHRFEVRASSEFLYRAQVQLLDLVSEVHVFPPARGTIRSLAQHQLYDATRRRPRRHGAAPASCRRLPHGLSEASNRNEEAG